jgi:hypothetical protein
MNRRGYKSPIPATARAVNEKCCGGGSDHCTGYYMGSEKELEDEEAAPGISTVLFVR